MRHMAKHNGVDSLPPVLRLIAAFPAVVNIDSSTVQTATGPTQIADWNEAPIAVLKTQLLLDHEPSQMLRTFYKKRSHESAFPGGSARTQAVVQGDAGEAEGTEGDAEG